MTKRRLASFLASSLAGDASNSKSMAACGGDSPNVISAIASWLEEMVRHYDSREWTATADGLKRTKEFAVSGFHGRPLSASIEGFLRRIASLAKLEESVFLVAAVYICRIIEKAPGLPISSCTVHRLLLQAIAVGAKFSLDHPRSNKLMASFADVPLKKFNQLEVKFLCLIQYDLNVAPNDLEMAKTALGMVEVVAVADATLQDVKRIRLGECGGTTYSTIEVATSGTTEEEGVTYNSAESEVDAMSHLIEDNNYNSTSDVDSTANGVTTPCLSECTTGSLAVSPEWSTQTGGVVDTCNNSNDDSLSNSSISQQQRAPVQGFNEISKTGTSSPFQMPTPERRLLCNSVIVLTAAE